MPFIIERNDITRMQVDAIVNAANNSLLGGGGVDGAIHRAAGPGLLAECRGLHGCETGEAKYTAAYRLPCRYVIHTVGPVWRGGEYGEEELLSACYRNSLNIAAELGCESVAFPLISGGVYGYPKREALSVAEREIRAFLEEHEMLVVMVLFDNPSFILGSGLAGSIREFIDDNYVKASLMRESERRRRKYEAYAKGLFPDALLESRASAARPPAAKPAHNAFGGFPAAAKADECVCGDEALDDRLSRLDESFSRNLLRRITESGMTDAQCYKRANIDRKLFSKIRSDEGYRPSKRTALAFAVALRLDRENTADLLKRAGYALSPSEYFDVIVDYFISNGRYDIYEINDALFAYDQPLLGS